MTGDETWLLDHIIWNYKYFLLTDKKTLNNKTLKTNIGILPSELADDINSFLNPNVVRKTTSNLKVGKNKHYKIIF